jgi:hypothetical protein
MKQDINRRTLMDETSTEYFLTMMCLRSHKTTLQAKRDNAGNLSVSSTEFPFPIVVNPPVLRAFIDENYPQAIVTNESADLMTIELGMPYVTLFVPKNSAKKREDMESNHV